MKIHFHFKKMLYVYSNATKTNSCCLWSMSTISSWLAVKLATRHYSNQWCPVLLMHICVSPPLWVKPYHLGVLYPHSDILPAAIAINYCIIVLKTTLNVYGLITLKRKRLHFDEIFITGCTGSCQNDNFQCSQWLKFRQNDDIFVSVKPRECKGNWYIHCIRTVHIRCMAMERLNNGS